MFLISESKEKVMILLKSIEGDIIIAADDIIRMSVLLRDLVEDLGKQDIAIPLNVDKNTMESINTWIERYKERITTSEKLACNLDSWDENYFSVMTRDNLLRLLKASDYMFIKTLTYKTSKYISRQIQNLSIEEIQLYLDC